MADSQSQWIIDATEDDFDRVVLQQSHERPVIVDFWAEWCGPCRMLAPVLEKLTRERNGAVALAKVNVDQNSGLAMEFNIESIPAVKAFRQGRVALEFVGVLPEPQLRTFFDRILPGESENLARKAAGLEDKDPAAAEKLYRQALEQDNNEEAALAGLARLLIARQQDAEAVALLDRLTPGGEMAGEADRLRGLLELRGLARGLPDEAALRKQLAAKPADAPLQYQLGCVLAAQGRFKDALDLLLAAGQHDKKLAASTVKETMVRIFHVVGVRSPLADEYRDKLTRMLY